MTPPGWPSTLPGSGAERRVRIQQLTFGQRLFGELALSELHDVLAGLPGFARFPSTMLALERIGVRDPQVYAATARRARTIEQLESPSDSVPVLAQFQGGLALLERLARTGAIGSERLERLVASLVGIDVGNGRYEGLCGAVGVDRPPRRASHV